MPAPHHRPVKSVSPSTLISPPFFLSSHNTLIDLCTFVSVQFSLLAHSATRFLLSRALLVFYYISILRIVSSHWPVTQVPVGTCSPPASSNNQPASLQDPCQAAHCLVCNSKAPPPPKGMTYSRTDASISCPQSSSLFNHQTLDKRRLFYPTEFHCPESRENYLLYCYLATAIASTTNH